MFRIIKQDEKHTKARLGILMTPHGTIYTPSYIIVATHGQIKCLKPTDIKKTKTQIVIANAYHLWPEALRVQKAKGKKHNLRSFLIKKLKTKLPTMTDSGGFQIFSLAFSHERKAKKIFPDTSEIQSKKEKREAKNLKRTNIRITGKGVYFKSGNAGKFLGPELSMKIQEKLGADIIFAFDECTSFSDDFKYNKKAMERTHKWAMRCLNVKRKTQNAKQENNQMLFGIVQGGRYKQLRIKSAKFIGSLPFDGFGIGGSYGKQEMVNVLKWTIPFLPEGKPRHLLGVGRIEDIFRAVENGVDLFDCVIPTREARHGRIWTCTGHYDIRKSIYKNKKSPLEKGCECESCRKINQSKLNSLFKNLTTLTQAQRYATIHNVWFFNNLLEEIRESIQKGKFREFKNKFLTCFDMS